MLFSARLRKLVDCSGNSHVQLSEAAGIHLTTLSEILSGIRIPATAEIIRLARVLKADLNCLLLEDEDSDLSSQNVYRGILCCFWGVPPSVTDEVLVLFAEQEDKRRNGKKLILQGSAEIEAAVSAIKFLRFQHGGIRE